MLAGCGASTVHGGGGGGGAAGGGSAGGTEGNCGYSNCAGCCFNGACQTGNSDAACGRNGGICVACGMGTSCSADQVCVIDPTSTWSAMPVSASVATLKDGTMEWDPFNGAPDPYVQMWCPAGAAMISAQTPVANDTYMPTWGSTMGNCIMTAGDLENVGFAMQVNDSDNFPPDDIIFNKATVKATDSELLAGFMNVMDTGNLMGLRINLIRQ
jgi:hypothetical protein